MPDEKRRKRWWGRALNGVGKILSACFELCGETFLLVLEMLSAL